MTIINPIDPKFEVRVIAATPNPNQVMYTAMHTCYAEDDGYEDTLTLVQKGWGEADFGPVLVKKLLAGNRGHFGILEHPTVTFHVRNFPHDVVVQHRTHRLASFAVQSQRYTGVRVLDVLNNKRNLHDVFYIQPVGKFTGHDGTYEVTNADRVYAESVIRQSINGYAELIRRGHPAEAARRVLAQGPRQDYVMSCNLRALLHFLDLRFKANAQVEIRMLCELMWPVICNWVPEIASNYEVTRKSKALLAP